MWSSLPYFNIAIGGMYFLQHFQIHERTEQLLEGVPRIPAVSVLPWCDVVSVVINELGVYSVTNQSQLLAYFLFRCTLGVLHCMG